MDTPLINYTQEIFEAQIDKSTVEETREITFVIASEATGTKHRNKYLYNWDNWNLENYNSNGIVGYQHNVYGDNMCLAPNPDDVIGKSQTWVDTFKGKRRIMAKATFEPAEINAQADKVFKKIQWGSLNATSVGVLPIGKISSVDIKDSSDKVVDRMAQFEGQELVEWSIVHIPADARALRSSIKNHTIAALSFVQRLMEDLSISDIKSMKVQEVLDAIDGKYKNAPLAQLELELSGPDPNLDKYMNYLTKRKS